MRIFNDVNNYNSNLMKNKLKILTILAIGIFLLPTCQKDPDLRWPDFKFGAIPLVTKDATKDQNIDFNNLSTFTGTVNVDLYFKDKDKPKSMDLMVIMNNDLTNSAVVQAGITSFPTSVNITTTTLVNLLPKLNNQSELKLGDFFRFYVNITLEDGTFINGNDTLYTAYSSALPNWPDASLEVVYTVVCPLDLNEFVGDYEMDDGYPSDLCVVTVSKDPDNAPNGLIITNFYGPPNPSANLKPVKITVNPATYEITLNSTPFVLAGWLWSTAYTDFTLDLFKGSLDACTGNFSASALCSCGAGSFGRIPWTFTKL